MVQNTTAAERLLGGDELQQRQQRVEGEDERDAEQHHGLGGRRRACWLSTWMSRAAPAAAMKALSGTM